MLIKFSHAMPVGMELITPLGSVSIGGRSLSDAVASISDRYVFVIGIGPDGDYEERLLEVNGEDARQLITNYRDYLTELLNVLDELVISLGQELGVAISAGRTEAGDPVQYVIRRLNAHDEYLRLVGDGWRRILDSTRLGRVSISLASPGRVYVTHSGNNITLNLVAEPIENGVIEVVTYTEGKATGIVRVRVGEDIVVKVDIRSPSSMIILSQARDIDRLGNPLNNLLPRVRDRVTKYVNELLGVMRRYGVVQ